MAVNTVAIFSVMSGENEEASSSEYDGPIPYGLSGRRTAKNQHKYYVKDDIALHYRQYAPRSQNQSPARASTGCELNGGIDRWSHEQSHHCSTPNTTTGDQHQQNGTPTNSSRLPLPRAEVYYPKTCTVFDKQDSKDSDSDDNPLKSKTGSMRRAVKVLVNKVLRKSHSEEEATSSNSPNVSHHHHDHKKANSKLQ